MTSFSKIVFGFLLLSLSYGLQAQDGFCCDPDAGSYQGPFFCGSNATILPVDGITCDPDCIDYDGPEPCTTIPLDGGLSLLAIAGGGLATAAMRRRREEELLEKEA